MKKIITSIAVVALVAGISTNTASAQHCTVQKGDSMFKIAERYNILFKDILEHNKHYSNQDLIHPNDKIEFPGHNSGGQQSKESSGEDDITTGNAETTGATESTQAREILKLVNQEREKQGVKPLELSDKLTSIANTKAQDMANKNYFSHTSPTYGSPFEMLQRFGVNYTSAGENIAQGQKTAREVMNAWLNSSGHRANILNANYTQLGVGYEKNGSHWVQLFVQP